MTQQNGPYRFTVLPRPAPLSGWRFRSYETVPGGEEIECEGAIFPSDSADGGELARLAALTAGEAWLASQPNPEYRDGEHYMLLRFAQDAAARIGD